MEIHKVWWCIYHPKAESMAGADPYKIVQQLKIRLEDKYIKYGDENIPIQRYGIMLTAALTAKMGVYLRQKEFRTQSASFSSE